jgi:cell division protein FtsW
VRSPFTLRGTFQKFPKGNRVGTLLLIVTLIMVTYGTFMVASASEGLAVASGSNFALMSHDVLYVLLAMAVLLVMTRIRVERLIQWGPGLFSLGLAGLIYVLINGQTTNGGQRWISIAGQPFQPSELFKMAAIFYVAWVVSRKHKMLGEWQHLAFYLAPLGLGLLLILFEHDLGTSSIVGIMAMSMLVMAGASALQMAMASGLAVTAIGIYITFSSYALKRFAFLHPNTHLKDENYQLFHSVIALGSGGLTGNGYGRSIMKWGLLPNPHTDFIFSIIGEELGFVGTLMVIVLFAAFLSFATRIIKACRNDELRLVAIGLTTWIILEALINIASVAGLWPVTGVPLPFFSYGGTALIMQMAAVGLLYNIAHDTSVSHQLEIRSEVDPFIPMSAILAMVPRNRPVAPPSNHVRSHRP